MELRDYFFGLPRGTARRDFASKAGTNKLYIYQLIAGARRPSTDLARALHVASEGKVPLAALRPDVWG